MQGLKKVQGMDWRSNGSRRNNVLKIKPPNRHVFAEFWEMGEIDRLDDNNAVKLSVEAFFGES